MNQTKEQEQPWITWPPDDVDPEDTHEDPWEYVCEDLTGLMEELNPDFDWTAEMKNFGWQGIDGYKDVFHCDNGRDMLAIILPDTECHFKIYKRDDCIAINNAHHDSPMWAEWYYIRPAHTA